MSPTERIAWHRIAMAARALADPDANERTLRSARVSFYRGFRALSTGTRNDYLLRATPLLSEYTLSHLPKDAL